MKPISITLLCIFFYFSIMSCRQNNKILIVKESLTDTIFVDLEEVFYFGLNTFELKKIVPIETSDILLINEIYRVEIVDSIIVIIDRDLEQVFLINELGRHTGKINNKGRGPDEYLFFKDAFVDKEDPSIYIPDIPRKRIIKFDINGTPVNRINFTNEIWDNFTRDRNGWFYFNFPEGIANYMPNDGDFWVYNNKGERNYITSIDHREYMKDIIPTVPINNMTLYNDTSFFVKRYDNHIYAAKDSVVIKRYYLDFNGREYTREIIEEYEFPERFMSSYLQHKLPFRMWDLFINDKFVYFTLWAQSAHVQCYYDKETKTLTPIVRYMGILGQEIPKIEPDRVVGVFADGFIYSVSALNFKLQVEEMKNQGLTNIDENIMDVYSRLNADDNPVLLFYQPSML